MGHDRADLPVHADQLRRQGRGRAGRPADHGRAEAQPRAVRADRLVVLLPVRALRRRSSASSPTACQTRHTLLVMAIVWSLVQFPMLGTVSLEDADRLPDHPGRGRRPGRAGRHPRHLQVVSRSAARHADGDHRPGLGAGRHHRRAGAQLDHRQLFLALGVRRAGRRRPAVGRAVADLRPRGHAGRSAGQMPPRAAASACPTAICSPAPASSPPAARASPATGAWRSASPGSPPTWWTAWATARQLGGNLSILPWVFGMFVVLGGGWISQRLKKAGVSSRLSRGVLRLPPP